MMASSGNSDEVQTSTSAGSTEYEQVVQKIRKRRKTVDVSEALKFILCPDDGSLSGNESEFTDDETELEEAILQCESDEEIVMTVQQMTDVEIENPSDDDDEISLSNLINNRSSDPGPMKSNYKWRRVEFQTSNETDWKEILSLDELWYEQSPSYFFSLIFTNDLIRHINKQTSISAMQKDGKELKVTENEMKSFLRVLLYTGIIKLPSYRHYWKTSLRIETIASAISRDRFDEIKRYLHFNDNNSQKPNNHPQHEKLHKVRPVLNAIQTNCKKTPPEEHECVDEQIIPTKARIAMKQYNPKKTLQMGL